MMIFFFGLVRLLYESAIRVKHETIGSAPIKTNTSYWPESFNYTPKNRKERYTFLGKCKKIIATKILSDLEEWFAEIPLSCVVLGEFSDKKKEIKEEILRCFSSPGFAIFSGILIPMLPFFASTIVTISLAAYFNLHLINITRDIKENCNSRFGLFCAHSRIDCFRCDNIFKKFIHERKAPKFEPSIIIETYRFYKSTDDCKENVDDFLENITKTKFSYIDYIYFVDAAHEILPQNDYNAHITLGSCLNNMQKKCRNIGANLGLHPASLAVTIFSATQNSEETSLHLEQMLFDITHMRSGSFKEVCSQTRPPVKGAKRAKI